MLNEPGSDATPKPKPKPGSDDPLHGVTLKMMLERLVEYLGWEEMSQRIGIRCFANDPSIGSSLKFLRKTPWARKKVEDLYSRYDFSDAKP
ncbi:MAG: VF530 family DNA-binding protein [Verrucomicrobiales bacterium]